MTRQTALSVAAGSAVVCFALMVAAASPWSRAAAADPPAPTPVVSVTTLPALPSPGAPTAHPATAAPGTEGGTSAPVASPMGAHGTQSPALPPPGTVILINGAVANPMYVTLDQLQKMRSVSITQKIRGHGIVTVTGAPLAGVLDLAQPTVNGGTSSPSAYVLVTGLNAQSVIVAFPEFEKPFADKIVLLAYLINGKPPKAGAATLVVQGDATGGRFVEGVTHIQVVQPTPSP